MIQVDPTDLYFIVLSAAIGGGFLTAISIAALVRFSKHEDAKTSYRMAFPDISLVIFALAAMLYGMWRAGLFG